MQHSKVFVVFVVLLGLSALVSEAVKVKSKISVVDLPVGTPSTNLPGLAAGIGRGFDLATSKVKAPIFQWHYTQGNVWTFPATNENYLTPDELWVTNTPDSSYTTSSALIRNFTDYQTEQASWHHMSIGIPGIFSFGMDKESKFVQKVLKDNNSTIYLVNRLFHLYEIATWPFDAVVQDGNFFVKMASRLPATRQSDDEKKAYNNFITAFGTHYIPQSSFGGRFYYMIAVNNSLFDTYSSEWVSKQVGISINLYDVKFGFNKNSNSSTESLSHEFSSNSETLIQWFGGMADEQGSNVDDFDTWYRSLVTNPSMVDPHYVPISDLIDNTGVSKNLAAAITDYLNTPPEVTKAKAMTKATAAPIAGLSSGIGRGYDVVSQRVRAPVVMWTYQQGQTWYDPYNNNQETAIPDQLYVTDIPSSIIDSTVDIFQSWDSYYHNVATGFGVNVGLGYAGVKLDAGFSRSKDEIQDYMKNNSRYLAIENDHIAHFALDMWPINDLPRQVQFMIDNLPAAFDSKKYGDFINAFGTHYLTHAEYGGKFNFTVAYDTELLNHHDYEWVQTQAKLSLSWQAVSFGCNWDKNSTTSTVDGDFKSHAQNYTEVDGGFPEVFQAQGFEAWSKTIFQNPAVLFDRANLVPITELIQDGNKKNNMIKAVINYATTGSMYA